jgi:hypothetical protein
LMLKSRQGPEWRTKVTGANPLASVDTMPVANRAATLVIGGTAYARAGLRAVVNTSATVAPRARAQAAARMARPEGRYDMRCSFLVLTGVLRGRRR